jgi:polyisoprenoid-binding protein YceI
MSLTRSVLALSAVLAAAAGSIVALSGAAPAPAPDTAEVAPAAGPIVFDFADPKGVNGLTIFVDSTVEPIVGMGGGISGTLTFDPAKPEGAKGSLKMPVTGVKFINQGMSDTLYSADWLDAETNPEITFEIASVSGVVKAGDATWSLKATGPLKLNGISKEVEIPLTATHLPGRAKDRLPGAAGDLLVLRADFTVNRSDFKITSKKRPVSTEVVGEKIQIRGGIVGMTKKE